MQYIGARYVPKFMGTFDPTQAYENMCVVDNGLGTSYISKIPAPAGTSLTDTTYWAIYGASSGAIINLQNQIGDLTDLDTTDKDSLVDAINENVADIQDLPNEIRLSKFKNKRICILGDSISDPVVYPPNWTQAFTNLVSTVGATVDNVSVSGTSIYAVSLDVTNMIPTGYDIYIIALGVNDFQGQFTLPELRTAVQTIATRCDTQNSDCYYISPIKGFVASWSNNLYTPLGTYRAFFEAMFNKCGFTVISGDNMPKLSYRTEGYYLHDKLHPDPTLKDIYANYIIDVIAGGESSYSIFKGYYRLCEMSPDATYTSANINLIWEDERTYKLQFSVVDLQVSNTNWTDVCKVGRGPTSKGFVSTFDEFIFSYNKQIFRCRVSDGVFQLLSLEGTGTFTIGGWVRGSVSYDQYIS